MTWEEAARKTKIGHRQVLFPGTDCQGFPVCRKRTQKGKCSHYCGAYYFKTKIENVDD